MRILFVSHSSSVFGAETSLAEIVSEAVGAGHEVYVSVPAEGPLIGRLQRVGAAVYICSTYAWMGKWHYVPIGLTRLCQALLAVPSHRRLQRLLRPDVVITNSSVIPSAAFAAKTLRIRHYWIVRESIVSNPSLKSALPKWFIARSIRFTATEIFTISCFVERQFRLAASDSNGSLRLARPKPTLSAPNDMEQLRKAKSEPSTQGAEDKVTMLLPGEFTPEKGQLIAVRAAAIAIREGCDLQLVMVGSGRRKMRSAMLTAIQKTGHEAHFTVLPYSDRMIDLYEAADCVVMSSRNEGYGRVTAEAHLCGVPVIGFDSGGTSEVMAGGGGILVGDISIRGLAEAIIEYCRAPSLVRITWQVEAAESGRRLAALPSQFEALMETINA